MSKFQTLVSKYGPRFMADLSLTREQVSGMFGNFAVETGYFQHMQELKPVVPGSAGGYGWAQWTGPRRRAYEAWCVSTGVNKSSDEANYGFVVHELRTTEANALRRLKLTTTPKTAAETFMAAYERPGVPHLSKRIKAAEEAFTILNQSVVNKPTKPKKDKKPITSTTNWSAVGAVLAGVMAVISHPGVQIFFLVIMAGFAFWIIRERNKKFVETPRPVDPGTPVSDETPVEPTPSGGSDGSPEVDGDGSRDEKEPVRSDSSSN